MVIGEYNLWYFKYLCEICGTCCLLFQTKFVVLYCGIFILLALAAISVILIYLRFKMIKLESLIRLNLPSHSHLSEL